MRFRKALYEVQKSFHFYSCEVSEKKSQLNFVGGPVTTQKEEGNAIELCVSECGKNHRNK